MKMTLLEMVQDIMNDMDADIVNSIDDTDEGTQVAQIIKSTYFALISNRNWPHLKRSIALVASGDAALPNYLTLQDEITEMVYFGYNQIREGETRDRYMTIRFLEIDEFLRKVNAYNNDAVNVQSVNDPGGIRYNIQNDRTATHYTTFNDKDLVFNSFDNAVDTTLQTSKVQAIAYVVPTWLSTDDFIPDLPDEAFTLLLEESKARATSKLKQAIDPYADKEAGRQNRWLSRKSWRINGGVQYPNYGRKGNRGRNPYFDKNDPTPTEI